MKDDVPVIRIDTGFVNVKRLLEQLKELDNYINVDFTSDGKIPEYIEFDRGNEDLYITIEEILTIFVNNKDEFISEENDNNNVKDFP